MFTSAEYNFDEESKSKYHTPSFNKNLFQNEIDSSLIDTSKSNKTHKLKLLNNFKSFSHHIKEQVSFGDQVVGNKSVLVLPDNKIYCKKCNALNDYSIRTSKKVKDNIRFMLFFCFLFFPLLPIGLLVYCLSSRKTIIDYVCLTCNSVTDKDN